MIVDIHNHILPCLDDGAGDLKETLDMCVQAAKSHITHIVATPHHMNGRYAFQPEDILNRVAEVNIVLRKKNIPVEILPGMEVHLYGSLADDLDTLQEMIVPLANQKKYVLIELPYSHIPHFTSEIFYRMQLKDYIPVIVHPERNEDIKKHPNLLVDLIQKGALAQVTAGSITGKFGKQSQKFSLKLLKHHLVHFVASDAHNTTTRSFQLSEAYNYIGKHMSHAYKDFLIQNAMNSIKGIEFIIPAPVIFERRKRLFSIGT